MNKKHLLKAGCLSAAVYLSGCAAVQVGQDVAYGRNALQTGRADAAVGYLMRAAETDPSYRIPYRIREGVLAYLGRAYYETGRDQEARATLEKAVVLDRDDALARLYLGLTLLRNGDRERGRKEVELGFKNITDTLDYINEDRLTGFFWDPGMDIRKDIRATLNDRLDGAELAMAAERIGRNFDEEIDRARRDEVRQRSGGSGGGGGS